MVWLWVFLASTCCRAEQNQEPLTSSAAPGFSPLTQRRHLHTAEQKNVSCVWNVHLDPKRKVLRWDSTRNVTEEECQVETPQSPLRPPVKLRKDGSHCCSLENALLHQGATVTVLTTSPEKPCKEVVTFRNSGQEGSAPRNFSCVLYNASSMNCSWEPGPRAPASVRYRLDVWTKMSEDEEDVTECPLYVVDVAGRQVGCHFPQLSQLTGENFYFFLNGSSPEAAIQFLDIPKLHYNDLEKYNPPRNISVHYNGSNYVIRWENPPRRVESTGFHILQYELDIRRQGRSQEPVFQMGKDTNVYLVPSTESRGSHSVRIRVRYKRGQIWSEWSPTLTFGLPEERVNYIVVIVPAVVATMVVAVFLMLLFRRCSMRQRLFPRIPEVNSVFITNMEISWEEDHLPPDAQEPKYLTVEETG